MHDDQACLEAARLEEVLALAVARKGHGVDAGTTSFDEPTHQGIHQGLSDPDVSRARLHEQGFHDPEGVAAGKSLGARHGIADDVVVDGANPGAASSVAESSVQCLPYGLGSTLVLGEEGPSPA